MKTILGTRFLDIPDGVTVTCKARHVTVTCLALQVTVTPSGMSRNLVPRMVFMTAALSLSYKGAETPDRQARVIVAKTS